VDAEASASANDDDEGLVEIEEAPAFIVEEIGDDRFVVLVPSVPTPRQVPSTSCPGSACTGSMYPSPRRSPW
jgi:hypothetical protein